MTKDEYLEIARAFEPGDNDRFPDLVREGMALTGFDRRKVADDLECMPGSITRWANSVSRPLNGMKLYVVKYFIKALTT